MHYGLIGEKLGHSFSKLIHEKISDYTYELKELKADEVAAFMKRKDFRGINVTIPYKEKVMPYLDYIDAAARKIGAVNTVVNRDGKLYGYNTDFAGLRALIEKQGFDYRNKKIVILGSGGTAKTACVVSESLGAGEIITVSRKGEVNYTNLYSLHGDCDYIINTTPVGMYPNTDEAPVDVSLFGRLKGVTDVVYNPLKTRLCLDCEREKIPCESGLYMLVAQAVLSCEMFTGRELERKKIIGEIYSETVKEKRNIVLVGMPGSGKSTVGKILAEMLSADFIDTDEIIKREYGDISAIFSEKGEKYFRDIESVAVKSVALKSGLVIATGGGAVLRRENTDYLKANGTVVFLDRRIEDIVPTADRPLSSDRESLEKRYNERYGTYTSCADIHIKVRDNAQKTAEKIMEMLK